MKKLKGWKTITANVMLLATSVGLVITGDEQAAVIGGIAAVINIALRFKTTTAVGRQE